MVQDTSGDRGGYLEQRSLYETVPEPAMPEGDVPEAIRARARGAAITRPRN